MVNIIAFKEHTKTRIEGIALDSNQPFKIPFWKKKRSHNEEYNCVHIYNDGDHNKIELSYFVGVDWITKDHAIYVQPKLNKFSDSEDQSETGQTDYLKMLFSALKHPEISKHTNDLFEIKFDKEYIEINQEQDLLTPLLVVQFLKNVKEIVHKGLKKSYYKVERNLYGKVKGKILINKSINQNLLRNKLIYTYCTYDEFGLNGVENRVIKKALMFVQRYLPSLKVPYSTEYTSELLNYAMPAFDSVDSNVELNEIRKIKSNAFYKEYVEGIKLARLILKRFGYNITNATQSQKITTPPFWIDMSKLFELYVLGLLKDHFKEDNVHYHYTRSGNELDFLLDSPKYKMVIDAKYKPQYQKSFENSDVRQVSGYARLRSVYESLNKDITEIIDCLIIYPDQINGCVDFNDIDLKDDELKEFVHIYRLGVKLPELIGYNV